MFGYFLSMRPKRFLLLAACASLAGCLSDNSPIMQVVPRLVVAPQNPRFQAIHYFNGSNPPAGQMLVKWSRSIADTQLNFKGYFVELWSSDTTGVPLGNEDNLEQLLDSVHIGRVRTIIPPDTFYKLADTFYTFTGIPTSPKSIPMGRYTVVIKGEKTALSETLSLDSSQYSALFDPLPLSDPTNLQATSLGPTQIGLRWTPSPDDTSAGFYRYVIYYCDTTKNDTGHVLALIPKQLPIIDSGVKIGWNDSTHTVGVPGVTITGQTTSEWPYKFWIKSQRIDSTFFYTDTNAVIWAGAEQVPKVGNDTGYLQVYNSDTIYFGSLNNQYDVAIDSSKDGKGQVAVTISGGTVTLTAVNYGVGFLARTDQDSSLGLVYYSAPLDDPSQFDQLSIRLPSPANGGVIVYVMMHDEVQLFGKDMWARIFIREQSNSSYINSNGAIDIKGSFQPGVTKDGSAHLGYY
ncbi:MAG: fibronectin type III domain-containing protein [Candidatus Kapaibacterium sp.]